MLKDGAPQPVKVKTGSTDGEKTEIVSGLKRRRPGDHRLDAGRPVIAAAPRSTLLSFDKVWKTYGEGEARVNALAGVSLSIDRGDFVAIMGPSGSGKSTAMNIIGCLDTPSAGRYSFEGIDAGRLDRNSRAQLRNLYIGFVFQGYNLLPRTTAAENVELPLIYRGAPGRERRELAMQALAEVGLERPRAPHAGRAFRRPAAARRHRARHRHPPCPAGRRRADRQSRHGASSHEIMTLLTALNRELGLTILMVTHEPDVAAYAQRTIGFLDGHIESDTLAMEAA